MAVDLQERFEGDAHGIITALNLNKLLFDTICCVTLLRQSEVSIVVQVNQHLQVLDEVLDVLGREQHCILLLQ